MEYAKIIWLYGMSGAGKTTLGSRLANELGYVHMDSDLVRQVNWAEPDFSPRGRKEYQTMLRDHVHQMQLGETGIVVSSITPYREMREKNRNEFGSDYYEIFLRCDLNTLIDRDPKGLYARALDGQIEFFTGVTDIFEEDGTPDLTIDTGMLSEADCYYILTQKIYKWLNGSRPQGRVDYESISVGSGKS